MKCTLVQKELADAVLNIQRAVSAKSTTPALEGILLDASSGKLTLDGTVVHDGLVECAVINAGEPIPERPPLARRCDTAVRQIELAAQYNCEKVAVLTARRHYAWYLKGVPHAAYYREQIVRMETLADVYRVTEGIKRDLHD